MQRVSTPAGGRLQLGIPREVSMGQKMTYLVRAVVVATYVRDDPNYPYSNVNSNDVYCDVLVYTNLPGGRFYVLPRVLVTPDVAGLQNGHVYRPRAAKRFLNGTPLGQTNSMDPSQLDGDHVVVGFIDGDRQAAFIVRFLPHPSKDSGNSPMLPAGQRMALRMVDGDPSFYKHHGSYFGISDGGDFVSDTTLANDGTLLIGGSEPAQGATGTGNHITRAGQGASITRSLVDASAPATPIEKLRETLDKNGYKLDMESLDVLFQVVNQTGTALKLSGSGASAKLAVGNGAQAVALAANVDSAIQTLISAMSSLVVAGTAAAPSVTNAAALAGIGSTASGSLAVPK